MGLLFGCGLCCMLLSIWAIIQLIVMGIFFKMEVLAFIEETEPHNDEYDDFDDFMKKTKENYQKVAINCWVAAALYVVTLGLSYMCIKKSKAIDQKAAEKIRDDEIFCKERAKRR
ncbi:hypothetical protein KGM_211785 [Danaus plexippus plexippus]|uniref:Uncharacterized protein n=1 Tax=Danaus plexippus plexippus TaxID=278856 RepID=A0A212EXB3_DANPL|nr:hypothetical protein KGM_211785 [Danaus plexippus plexippus]